MCAQQAWWACPLVGWAQLASERRPTIFPQRIIRIDAGRASGRQSVPYKIAVIVRAAGMVGLRRVGPARAASAGPPSPSAHHPHRSRPCLRPAERASQDSSEMRCRHGGPASLASWAHPTRCWAHPTVGVLILRERTGVVTIWRPINSLVDGQASCASENQEPKNRKPVCDHIMAKKATKRRPLAALFTWLSNAAGRCGRRRMGLARFAGRGPSGPVGSAMGTGQRCAGGVCAAARRATRDRGHDDADGHGGPHTRDARARPF